MGKTVGTEPMRCVRLIFDSPTIFFFFTATKTRDKATDAETQFTLNVIYYYEGDPDCKSPTLGREG